MGVDRGVLARIDRKLLVGLEQGESSRMVRVPVSSAKWSTWKRYCDSSGMSMGRAIVALIDWELLGIASESTGDEAPVFAHQAEEKLASRESEIARRERDLKVSEGRLRARSEHLRRWEAELEAREQRVELASKLAARRRDAAPKVGRHERCPCGSGLKHKHCHGLVGRQPKTVLR